LAAGCGATQAAFFVGAASATAGSDAAAAADADVDVRASWPPRTAASGAWAGAFWALPLPPPPNRRPAADRRASIRWVRVATMAQRGGGGGREMERRVWMWPLAGKEWSE